jgi:hypothetical protein
MLVTRAPRNPQLNACAGVVPARLPDISPILAERLSSGQISEDEHATMMAVMARAKREAEE